MAIRTLFAALLLFTLAACGGGDGVDLPDIQKSHLSKRAKTPTRAPIVFTDLRDNYTITTTTTGFSVAPKTGLTAAVHVTLADTLQFTDTSVSMDTDGLPGKAYRIYQAAFSRTPDAAGLGYWLDVLNEGLTLREMAGYVVISSEFKAMYGESPTHLTVINKFYRNVLHRDGEPAGITYWKGILDENKATIPEVLLFFSDSTENQVAVLPEITDGIRFIAPNVSYVPTANPGATRQVAIGQQVKLNGAASTASHNSTLSYSWTLLSKPVGSRAGLVSAQSVSPVLVTDVAGVYEASLTVSDGVKVSAPAKIKVFAQWMPEASAIPATGSYVHLVSDSGDYIGAGRKYTYTSSDSKIQVKTSGTTLNVLVDGDQSWFSDFVPPNTVTKLAPGYYSDLTRSPFHMVDKGGLSWSGEGRGCNTLTGWFMIDSVTYQGDAVSAIEMRFAQHCEGGSAALRGQIRWNANDQGKIPGPVLPVPAGLWEPAANTLPATGNYVHLSSTSGDYIGAGGSYTYTQANSVLTVNGGGASLRVGVNGDQDWTGEFVGMSSLSQLEPGYYGALTRFPFHNAVKGGLSWTGEGRGCNTLKGWFVVDSVTYTNNALTAIELRFQQNCEGGSTALRGKVRWSSTDTSTPPGPVMPVPTGLWTPPTGTTPRSGNYVYLSSMGGDYIGQGKNYLYTQANSTLQVTNTGNRLRVTVPGTEYWDGTFVGMSTINELKPGYYPDLSRYPFHNAAKGGLSWTGAGRGCNSLSGWFAVDRVTYVAGALKSITLRFQQNCEGGSAALRGKIQWVAPT